MKINRIAVDSKQKSSESLVLENKLKSLGFQASADISRVYTVLGDFSGEELEKIAAALCNPVVETVRVSSPVSTEFDWVLETGFLPGVTDNVAHTATEIIEDLLKLELGINKVFTSQVIFLSGSLTLDQVEQIAGELINSLIERHHIKTKDQYLTDGGMDRIAPLVKLSGEQYALKIDLNLGDEKLQELGKRGIIDPETGERRGPLAMDLDYMQAVKNYFAAEGRQPTDIELESIAQTWSEHCKHTIFADALDEVEEGVYKRFIKGATEKIRKELGDKDFCISVFKDNSGGIIFDDEWMITDKAETHNSPSALDPFGGSITGIVGVNRDTVGFGMGALPIVNKYGYCFGHPEDKETIYRGKGKKTPVLSPRRIMEGVIHGVNVGGNCSGIPTPTGFVFFDDNYKGKPLVFVGTIGMLPRKLPNGAPSDAKCAQVGDNIVVIGGRVGKDGIHGATFSSEAMDEGSPATAVQIGDPITQKKLSDAVVKEARDLGLYNSITDNGAGGLSCSVAEMAEECGGFDVELEKIPLKYPGLQPWETWISESQERMTLSVPDKSLKQFMDLMHERGVESTVIGRFDDTGKGVIHFNGEVIFDLDLEFLHNGLPGRKLTTAPYPYSTEEPELSIENQEKTFLGVLGSHNNCSFEFISKQYDHEVQNNAVIGPLVGKGRVNGKAAVIKPLAESQKGAVMSQALLPRLSEISCYDMAGAAIDTAIRQSVAAGADIEHMALMDNFCWCSSNDPERLGQLKDAVKGCYDVATAFLTPFISGKDSMFNDFNGYDAESNPVKISVPPTLMISSLGVIEDVSRTITPDFKAAGDLVYLIGETRDELGAGELYNHFGKVGANAPELDAEKARKLYQKFYEVNDLFASSEAVQAGGLGIALARMAIAGQLGASIDLDQVPSSGLSPEKILYSESLSRFVVTICPHQKKNLEAVLEGFTFAEIGIVTEGALKICSGKNILIDSSLEVLSSVYREKFAEY